jgi:hypothetical protein
MVELPNHDRCVKPMAAGNGSDRANLAQSILVDDPEFLRGIVERAAV